MKNKTYIKIVLIVLSTMVFIRPTESYILTLLKSFVFHFMIGYLVLAIIWLFRRKYVLAFFCVGAFFALFNFISMHTVNPHSAVNNQQIAVAHYNVLMSNNDYKTIIRNANSTNADLLSFQEVDSGWAMQLEVGLRKQYPYFTIEADDIGGFGIAVFSKHPIKNSEVIYLENKASLTGTISMYNKDVAFITTHAANPISRSNLHSRNRQLDSLAQLIETKKTPVIAIGDYNAVPWDTSILAFKDKTGLTDSRKSITATYPRILGKFGIPIDYIFYSPQISCIDFKPIYESSSDHAGILGTYNINL